MIDNEQKSLRERAHDEIQEIMLAQLARELEALKKKGSQDV